MYCRYYQAQVNVPFTWFITGILRNEDHIVFERAMQGDTSWMEFFVAPGNEQRFLEIIQYLCSNGYIISFEEKLNRLAD